jgi:uncharacterized protein
VKRSIYISRKVLNSDAIKSWAKQQGFTTCLPDDDLHVTVAFDKKKHDWRELPLEAPEKVDVLHPDERAVEEFRGGAIVLEIYSSDLVTRWAELIQSGLHWKWPDYRPHITITYNIPENLDLAKVTPYDGVIELGPEIATEVNWNIRYKIDEDTL